MMFFLNIMEAVLGGHELPVNYEDNTVVKEPILTKKRRFEFCFTESWLMHSTHMATIKADSHFWRPQRDLSFITTDKLHFITHLRSAVQERI